MDKPILNRAAAAVALVCVTQAAMGALAQQVTPWRSTITASADASTLPEDRGADGLWQTLNKLNTRASLMMIVAHPDDEDGGMMALESRGAGVRVGLLTLNRGEGGQNAISSESYDALGLLRTNELLEADRYAGVEQFFTRVVDYGFSKTIDEALGQWNHDRVLYDTVRAVRLYRPLVLAAVFSGNITDGHGQHQVSGAMAQEAFTAAGDPSVFPDQIAAGLRPWSPLKVYARVPGFTFGRDGRSGQIFDYATGRWSPAHFYDYVTKQWSDTMPTADITIPEGNFDPVLGRSYLQIAREGWSQQKSQYGGGYSPLPGPYEVQYHRYGSRVQSQEKAASHETSFFDGVDVTLGGIAALAHAEAPFLKQGLSEIQRHVTHAIYGYLPSNPGKVAPELRDGYAATRDLIAKLDSSSLSEAEKYDIRYERQIKLAQFNTALAQALGLEVNALVSPRPAAGASRELSLTPEESAANVTPGHTFEVRLHATSAEGWGPGSGLTLARTWVATPQGEDWHVSRVAAPDMENANSRAADLIFSASVPKDAAATRPYFTRPNTEQPYYDISDPSLLNRPFAPYPVEGWAEFDYGGVPVRVGQVVQTMHRVHGLGMQSEPLVVTPQLSVTMEPAAGVVPLSSTSFPVAVSVANEQQSGATGTLRLTLPAGWTSEPAEQAFTLAAQAREEFRFSVHVPALTGQVYQLHAEARSGNHVFRDGFITAGYPGLRPYNLYRPATYSTRGVDVRVAPGLRVGYIMGTGDEVPQSLRNIGVEARPVSAEELATGDLGHYDTIIVGIRAYAARADLLSHNQRLLDFVKNGGTAIVEYQSGSYDQGYTPYPVTLGRSPEKVVDEHNQVTILTPADPLLNYPNRITPGDFRDWVEERGHSFASSWSSQYTALTETHDPGQDPQRGGLLVAHYGKGTYIYVAYALYRQLPEGVPGAYRLFANLLSAGHTGTGAVSR